MNGVLETTREYGSAVILLAMLALVGLLLRRPAEAPAAEAPAAEALATAAVLVGCESWR